MKKRFRLGLALLLVCLTFAALTLCASAAEPTLALSAPTDAVRGEIFEVQLLLTDNPGVWYPTVCVSYDAGQLELLSVVNGDIYADDDLPELNYARNPFTISFGNWESGKEMDLENNYKNGTLATLNFRVRKIATFDTTAIGISSYDIINMDETRVTFRTVDTAVTVRCRHSFGEWQTVREASATEDGERIRTCRICGYVEREGIPSTVRTGTYGDNLTYILDTNTGVLTISGKGKMPGGSEFDYPWFEYSSSIRTVKISNGVTSIGHCAFYGFYSSLTSVTIPDSVTRIEDYAFCDCQNLTNVTIPKCVMSIGYRSFLGCGLTSITTPDSVMYIGDGAFDRCGSLKSIRVLNSDCQIYDSESAFPSAATIYGFAGSTAEAYATKHNRTFVALDPTSLTAQVSAATYASGTATLRVTATPTVTEGMEVERYGVFFAPAKYADSYATNGQVVVKEGAIASGKPFVADLTDIPESAYDVKIYAWAFVKLVGVSDPVVCPLDPVSIHDIVK